MIREIEEKVTPDIIRRILPDRIARKIESEFSEFLFEINTPELRRKAISKLKNILGKVGKVSITDDTTEEDILGSDGNPNPNFFLWVTFNNYKFLIDGCCGIHEIFRIIDSPEDLYLIDRVNGVERNIERLTENPSHHTFTSHPNRVIVDGSQIPLRFGRNCHIEALGPEELRCLQEPGAG